MPDEPDLDAPILTGVREALEDDGDEPEGELPTGFLVWGGLIHAVLATVYFLVISAIAIAVDLGLHWFETLGFVQKYKLSRIIGWEIELMAYTLATIDAFLFMRMLIKPAIEWIARTVRRER